MDIEKKLKKELYRNNKRSKEIVGLISETFKKDPDHEFNRVGLLRDRKSEYPSEDYEILLHARSEKIQKTMETVQKVGAAAVAYAMRHYCQILADPNRTEGETTTAMTDAVHLLFTIARIGKDDTEYLNKAVINSCARDSSLLSLDEVVTRQWTDRQTYYSAELRTKMLDNLKARTIA